MLPFEFIAGRVYRRRYGGLATCLLNASDRGPEVTYPIVFHHHGDDEFQSHTVNGDFMTGTTSLFDIIMPADTWGVYHVSDGDTPLKDALERWWKAGGKWEFKDRAHDWESGCPKMGPAWCKYAFYRAAGCTEDREFPQPKPKMPDRVWGGACTDAGLLAELKAWFAAGGGIECKHSFIRDEWEPIDAVLWREECLYRALGCTAEPVIDPPQPPDPPVHVVTCEMMAEAAKDWLGKMCNANWWQQRAQQDSRP